MIKYLDINCIYYVTLCGLKEMIFLVFCNFRSKNELYNYGLLSHRVSLVPEFVSGGVTSLST